MTMKAWIKHAHIVGEKMKAAKDNGIEYISSEDEEDDFIDNDDASESQSYGSNSLSRESLEENSPGEAGQNGYISKKNEQSISLIDEDCPTVPSEHALEIQDENKRSSSYRMNLKPQSQNKLEQSWPRHKPSKIMRFNPEDDLKLNKERSQKETKGIAMNNYLSNHAQLSDFNTDSKSPEGGSPEREDYTERGLIKRKFN